MDDPVHEIAGVIRSLTQTSPSIQRETVNQYFTSNASFLHPFCRTGSFYLNDTINSRNLIQGIYRWYKIMSPQIDLEINSIAYDPKSLTIYAHITQDFRIWTAPFYRAHVNLVTVLQLVQEKKSQKYLIQSQNDLYQVNEFVRFFLFGGWILVSLWQLTATIFCVIGAVVLWPQTWIEENYAREGWKGVAR